MQFNTTHLLHSLKPDTTIFCSTMKFERSYDLSNSSQKSRVFLHTRLLYLFTFLRFLAKFVIFTKIVDFFMICQSWRGLVFRLYLSGFFSIFH